MNAYTVHIYDPSEDETAHVVILSTDTIHLSALAGEFRGGVQEAKYADYANGAGFIEFLLSRHRGIILRMEDHLYIED